jgi:4-hydroxybenzoate polyprenyltransferase
LDLSIDIQNKCWFDRFLPQFAQPYARLARWDRPIGIWLLYWPCAWGLLLAPQFTKATLLQQFFWLGLFFIGAVAMRGAGCTINDLWDRKLDAQVERTKHRPLASGAIGLFGALIFLILQCLLGLIVLYSLPTLAQIIALLYVPLVAVYPLMKRLTMWPQLFLAVVFNAGVLIGWTTTGNPLSWITLLLYFTTLFWTLGYDTVYAHMDRRDDIHVGIKSTVVLLGERAVDLVIVCWWATLAGWLGLGLITGFPLFSWLMFGCAFFLQTARAVVWQPDDDSSTLIYFRSQNAFAFMLTLACWYAALNRMTITG